MRSGLSAELLKSAEYMPVIIQNPYYLVLNNENWLKRVENYYIREQALDDALV